VFDEVFDEAPTEPGGIETEPHTEPAGFETAPPAPEEPAAEEPAFEPEALPDSGVEVPVFEPEPEAAPPPPIAAAPRAPEASFADLGSAEEAAPAGGPSEAAEVAVPVDMVEKIAQRVVAQVSEKVVREIAWEVIPELAEALIKKEIERLRAELEKI
jgi:hypothetical protein